MTQAAEAPARTPAQVSGRALHAGPWRAPAARAVREPLAVNARHMRLARVTLGTLMLTGLYVMLVASGAFSGPRIFN
jgi:hypothetical protein